MEKINSVAELLTNIRGHVETNWTMERIISLRNKEVKPYPNREDILKRYQSR